MNNCPWCESSNVEFVEKFSSKKGSTSVECVECLDCGMRSPYALSDQSALSIWNRIRINKPLTDN